MRKVSILMVLVASAAMGLPYAYHQKWWLLLFALLLGFLWVYPTNHYLAFRSTFSLLILAIIGAASILLGYPPIWILTNFIFLLVAWDLYHFNQTYQEFAQDPVNSKATHLLFLTHLQRLAIVTSLGWGLGLAAIYIRTNLSFVFGLALVILAILGLRQITRLLT